MTIQCTQNICVIKSWTKVFILVRNTWVYYNALTCIDLNVYHNGLIYDWMQIMITHQHCNNYFNNKISNHTMMTLTTMMMLMMLVMVKMMQTMMVDTLRPRQNSCIFQTTISDAFLYENVWISIPISMKFVLGGPSNIFLALVQIMAWRQPGDKPLSGPMIVRLPTHICVALPQWVTLAIIICQLHRLRS